MNPIKLYNQPRFMKCVTIVGKTRSGNLVYAHVANGTHIFPTRVIYKGEDMWCSMDNLITVLCNKKSKVVIHKGFSMDPEKLWKEGTPQVHKVKYKWVGDKQLPKRSLSPAPSV